MQAMASVGWQMGSVEGAVKPQPPENPNPPGVHVCSAMVLAAVFQHLRSCEEQ